MSQKGYVYIMYDTDDWEGAAPLYIGKTKNAKQRIYSHFNSLKNGKMTEDEYNSVKCIRLAELPTYTDAGIIERYLVGKYMPKGNTQMTKEGSPTIFVDTSKLTWETIKKEDILSKPRKYVDPHEIPTARKHKKSSFMRLLKGSCMVACDGFSQYIYYPKSCKQLVFYIDGDPNRSYDDLKKCFPDALLFPEETQTVFLSIVFRLGIPFIYDWFNDETVPYDIKTLLTHPEQDEMYIYSDKVKARERIQNFINSNPSYETDTFYSVWAHHYMDYESVKEDFDDYEDAVAYAEKMTTEYTWHRVVRINGDVYETVYTTSSCKEEPAA